MISNLMIMCSRCVPLRQVTAPESGKLELLDICNSWYTSMWSCMGKSAMMSGRVNPRAQQLRSFSHCLLQKGLEQIRKLAIFSSLCKGWVFVCRASLIKAECCRSNYKSPVSEVIFVLKWSCWNTLFPSVASWSLRWARRGGCRSLPHFVSVWQLWTESRMK